MVMSFITVSAVDDPMVATFLPILCAYGGNVPMPWFDTNLYPTFQGPAGIAAITAMNHPEIVGRRCRRMRAAARDCRKSQYAREPGRETVDADTRHASSRQRAGLMPSKPPIDACPAASFHLLRSVFRAGIDSLPSSHASLTSWGE